MKVKYLPAMIVPVIIAWCILCLGLLVWHIRSLDHKILPVGKECAFYVNTVEYRGGATSTFATFAQETLPLARVDFYQEVKRIEEAYGTHCTERSCPDSVEVALYRLCDASEGDTLLEVIIFK